MESPDYNIRIDAMRREAQELEQCPPATQDIGLNMANRQRAIDEASYGPANPQLDESGANDEFWQAFADKFNTSMENAMTMRCGNCTFFIRTRELLTCIEAGLGEEGDPETAIEGGELGYCQAWDFKCASQRTCYSWAGKKQ